MRRQKVHYRPTVRKAELTKVHRAQAGKTHRHVCANEDCKLTYEDNCETPERNDLCRPCNGQHRTWVNRDGLTALDPRTCCVDNTEVVTTPETHERFNLAGPGPWFQCRKCKRAHGHPCVDNDLLNRPHHVGAS